jgi:hypothetical protein
MSCMPVNAMPVQIVAGERTDDARFLYKRRARRCAVEAADLAVNIDEHWKGRIGRVSDVALVVELVQELIPGGCGTWILTQCFQGRTRIVVWTVSTLH